jgi:3-oxoacyl-[acyl-carrier-protein] synthase II
MRRVAITGLGAVSALGVGVPSFWDGLVAGRSGVREVTRFQSKEPARPIAAEVPDFDPAAWLPADRLSLLDRRSSGWPRRSKPTAIRG